MSPPSRHRFLASIARAHGRELKRYFAARLADASEAQDMVQEVYLRLLKLGQPEQIRCPQAYLYRVAATVASEHWVKGSHRLGHVELDEASIDVAPAPDEALERAEHVHRLEATLGELAPKVRAALIWAHRDGHTYEEISAKLAVPKNRVKKYLAKALAHCRKSIPEAG